VLINPIIGTRARHFCCPYHPTREILVSEVGGSDRIGFFNSGYDRKHVTIGVTSGRIYSIIGLTTKLHLYRAVI
jgi:hypothetical protein